MDRLIASQLLKNARGFPSHSRAAKLVCDAKWYLAMPEPRNKSPMERTVLLQRTASALIHSSSQEALLYVSTTHSIQVFLIQSENLQSPINCCVRAARYLTFCLPASSRRLPDYSLDLDKGRRVQSHNNYSKSTSTLFYIRAGTKCRV